MVISNKKNKESLGSYIIFLIPLILLGFICYLMMFKKKDFVIVLFIFLIFVLLLSLFRLKYTEFENSGYVITIKKKHPIFSKGFVVPILEFPADMLKSFYIKKNIIYLNVKSSKPELEKTRRFKIYLTGFNTSQREHILKSLSNTISK